MIIFATNQSSVASAMVFSRQSTFMPQKLVAELVYLVNKVVVSKI